jgi:hypothetical protein
VVGWHSQPEVLACYRIHASNQTHDLTRTGRTARDIRRTLDAFGTALPADLAAAILPEARALHAREFLSAAKGATAAGSAELAATLLREALAIDADALTHPEFAALLQDPAQSALRRAIRSELLRRLD